MKIIDIINGQTPSLSFEVFPPKTTDKYESVSKAVKEIAELNPSYMSVTYGAGGGRSKYTSRIAQEVQSCGVTSLAHLTCISSSKQEIGSELNKFNELGIKNILALRGDIPDGLEINELDFHYAYELIDEIKKYGDFCIGGACYPEQHPESISAEKDIEYLKLKIDHGCDFLTTQMFFDNNIFFSFVERLRKIGINAPVVAGLMPVTSTSQLERIVFLSGNALPQNFMKIVNKYVDDPISFRKACIEFTVNQAREIYENGFNSIHIYSMNKPDVAKEIQTNLRDVIK
mgnify:CR=1 FL=1